MPCPNTSLVVYFLAESETFARQALLSNLYLFNEAKDNQEIEYLNIAITPSTLLLKKEYKDIIFHYSVFAERMNTDDTFLKRVDRCNSLKNIKGHRVALVQDEYVRMGLLNITLNKLNIHKIYSCVPEHEYSKAYPNIQTEKITTTLTGFVDMSVLEELTLKKHSLRPLDVSYRARKLPKWLGSLATNKYQIAEHSLQILNSKKFNIAHNISTNPFDTLQRQAWLELLANSRCVLGVESGVSILDFDGRIHEFSKNHSENETFELSKKIGIPYDLSCISPRHFEAAQTRTCQLLIEGDYSGIFKPNRHYIPIKKDFSNLADIYSELDDIEKCESIAENAYNEIILNKKYSQKSFAFNLLRIDGETIPQNISDSYFNQLRKIILTLRNKLCPLNYPLINLKLLYLKISNIFKVQ